MISVSSPLMAKSPHSAHRQHVAGVPRTQYVVVQEPHAYTAIFAQKPKITSVPGIQEITKKLEEWQFQYQRKKPALNIEVIDDTALIETSVVGKEKFNKYFQESEKEKKPNRRGGKGRKKKKNADERMQNHASVEKKAVAMVYSREEIVALRFENLDDQKKKWAEVYGGLSAAVAAEYDGLVSVPSFRFDRRPSFQKLIC